MNTIVSRTCIELLAKDAEPYQDKEPRPLEAFRDAPAYVLLGDPGAGKTTAFKAEREALGEQACLITARDFLTFDPQAHPEWLGKTLFIDGLDEVRAGSSDARTPFDAIRGRLDTLGKPRFRLSCRAADWLGANDRRHLESVSPDDKVTVLRLNPLTDSDIAQLLAAHPHVDDAEAFIAEAKQRGIGDLLANPQTLELLANAVAGGSWPESRKETFEMACAQMVREHNDEHLAASTSSGLSTPAQLLDTAGRLCAIQLLAGVAGYTPQHGQPDNEYPALDQFDSDSPNGTRPALTTKLFKGVSDNRFIPIHRHVAEFLGARYLAGVINNGLPARRVIALITGADGGVVTELRGLSAWLTAHCQEVRKDLIERDPIGVGLYGDIREFSRDAKRALLESLSRESSRLDFVWETAPAFSALATPDMEPALREVLQDSNRDPDHQIFIDFVLCVLEQGTPLPCLAETLLEIVRDDTRWPRVKRSALHAFMRRCPDSRDKTSKLKGLLVDIQEGSVSDPDDVLLGSLLTQLYPQDISPSQVWDYLYETDRERFYYGTYQHFWETDILAKSSDKQVAELLDNLSQQFSELWPVLELHHLRHLPLKLLARGLKTHGDQLDTARLYDWLGAGEVERYRKSSGEATQEIRSWLEQHPEVQKAVILEGLDQCPESGEIRLHEIYHSRLYRAELPSDFGLWCLEQADAMANAKPRIAKHLLIMVGRVVRGILRTQSGDGGLSLDILQEYAQKNVLLKAGLAPLLDPCLLPPEYLEERRENQTYLEEEMQQEEQWFEYVRSNEVALRENRAAPALLFQLSQLYFGVDSTNTGPKAIEEALQDNQHLIQAVLQGFCGTVDRQDIPAFEEILSVQAQGRMHYLAWPFLAGLAEIERTAPEDASRWDDDRIRKTLAFYYGTALSQPEWYQRLLAVRPELVAKVQVQIAVSAFRRGCEHVGKLWELAHDKAHAEVAKHASLPLLRAFPIRCNLKQLQLLHHLLWAAVRHADRTSLRALIERKLSRKSTNDAQRVYWLAAGFAIASEVYQASLNDFAQGHEHRIRHLAEFFYQDHVPLSWFDALGIPGLACFIRLVGGYVEPGRMYRGASCLLHSQFVSSLIRQNLATSPAKEAGDVLTELLADPALSAWRDVLSQARDTQRLIRRDADYRHPTIEQVCQTLKGGTPANPGDLAALVLDRLGELAVQIRIGNTDDWRQYWNLDSHGRPENPRPENSCRDALLSDLRQRLSQGVDAQPEGQYANDKRADIRVAYGGFQVPVEIKKNDHRQLWRAPRNQLIAQYTSAPGTDGYGIYLVFWFGKEHTQLPDSGHRPADAEELKARLETALSPEEARKISVCVIDVSRR